MMLFVCYLFGMCHYDGISWNMMYAISGCVMLKQNMLE
jgi:hypothetical protein